MVGLLKSAEAVAGKDRLKVAPGAGCVVRALRVLMRVQLCVVEVGKDKPLQVRSRQQQQQQQQRFCSMQRM